MPYDFDEEWLSASPESDPFEDDDTLEFVITSADEEEETTWRWDGRDWQRSA